MATQNVADVGQPEPRIRNCKYEIGRKRCAEVQDDDSGCLGPRFAQCAFGLWTPQLVMFVQALKTQPAGTFANYVHPSDGSWLPWLDRARSKHERFEDAMATRPPQTRLDNSDSENAKTSVILWESGTGSKVMELAVARKTFRATGKDITRVMVKAIKAMVKATAKAGEVVERARSTRDLRACGDHGEARRLQRLPRRLPIIANASLSSSMLNCVKNLSVL